MSAVEATFVDLRTVKSRSVMQLIFEVPLERADAALQALGGIPQPGTDRWVGIARLVAPDDRAPAEPTKDYARSLTAKARYADLDDGRKAVARSALLAKDMAFQHWLFVTKRAPAFGEEGAAAYIRSACSCKSRREIAESSEKLRLFEALEGSYQLWRDGLEARQ